MKAGGAETVVEAAAGPGAVAIAEVVEGGASMGAIGGAREARVVAGAGDGAEARTNGATGA